MVEALTVTPEQSVRELVELLLRERADGACVVEASEDGPRLVGVVTTMDLVFQQKQVHLPSFFAFMDFMIPLEPPERLRHELDKISASRVLDMMSAQPLSVGPDTPMDEVASLMVDKHVSIVPVIEGDRLVGMVTKATLLRAVFARSASRGA